MRLDKLFKKGYIPRVDNFSSAQLYAIMPGVALGGLLLADAFIEQYPGSGSTSHVVKISVRDFFDFDADFLTF